MNQAELLRYLVDALEASNIEYMIVGSQASIYYGEPRFTQDIDVVVEVRPAQLDVLLERFSSPEFYVSEDAARAALDERGQFNVIHAASGVKIDMFVSKDTEYDRTRFERRHRQPFVPGKDAYFARAEDIILYKLLYFRQGGSDRHLRDVAGILAVSGPDIDLGDVAEWAGRLGVDEIWRAVLRQVREG